MPHDSKAPVVRGARLAAQQFRSEVARELGIEVPAAQRNPHAHKTIPTIQGRVAQRMIELAEQQMSTS